jgi:hypothetical protein
MSRFRFPVFAAVAFACLSSCVPRETLDVSFYYQTLCASCGESRDNQVLLSLLTEAARSARHARVKLAAYDAADDAAIARLLESYDAFAVPESDRRLPIAFAGGAYYAGVTGIEELAQVLRSR